MAPDGWSGLWRRPSKPVYPHPIGGSIPLRSRPFCYIGVLQIGVARYFINIQEINYILIT